jgi:hypothetical protein
MSSVPKVSPTLVKVLTPSQGVNTGTSTIQFSNPYYPTKEAQAGKIQMGETGYAEPGVNMWSTPIENSVNRTFFSVEVFPDGSIKEGTWTGVQDNDFRSRPLSPEMSVHVFNVFAALAGVEDPGK